MKKRRKYSAETKAEAVLSVLRGEKTIVEAAREIECHPNLLSKWQETFLEFVTLPFEKESDNEEKNQKIAELERMVGKLTVQNEFLKKASGSLGRA